MFWPDVPSGTIVVCRHTWRESPNADRIASVRRFHAPTTGLAGVAGLYAGRSLEAEEQSSVAGLANEDGYKLWLRYAPPVAPTPALRRSAQQIMVEGASPTCRAIRTEMAAALSQMLGAAVPDGSEGLRDGAIVVGTPDNSPAIRSLGWQPLWCLPSAAPRADQRLSR